MGGKPLRSNFGRRNVDITGMTVPVAPLPRTPSGPTVRFQRRQVVVTAHGWMAGRRSMRRLNRAFGDAGFETINWGYPSLRGSIVQHGNRLGELLTRLTESHDVERVHLVTHSMGGIVARVAIQVSGIESFAARKCGRLVMMAPPNAGSRLTRLPLGPFASWFPHLSELSERSDSLVNQLPLPQRMRVSVLAASRDFVVTVAATRLACQVDHLVVPTTHQRLASDSRAIRAAVGWIAADSKLIGSVPPRPARTKSLAIAQPIAA